jgi:hypothetical protein
MAIKIAEVSGNMPSIGSDVESFSCQIIGDDVSVEFVINVSKTPFDFKFNVVPSSVDLVLDGVEGLPAVTGVIGTNETGDTIITCTLDAPLANVSGHLEDNPATYMSGTFIYNE